MSSEIIIANPIYDVVFKRLMEDTKNARFFIKTLLNQDVEEVQFKPQEYILPEDYQKRLTGQSIQMPGALTVMRLDFVATIRNADGTHQKVLVEVQKGKKNIDVMRFRNYLAEHYKREDDIILPYADGDFAVQKKSLHIIAIYIVAFDLPHIKTSAAKIGREYIDLLTGKEIKEKEDFVEQLTHDCIIIQTGRIHGSIQTDLDALLSVFEQRYFQDEHGHLKQYSLSVESEEMRHFAETLMYIGASAEGRREMDAEEELRRVIDCYANEKMQKIQQELQKKEKALAEKEQALTEKDNVITEKDKALAENKKALADQAKQIAELKAKLSSRKSQ
jgi:hypothetical protein